MLPWTGVADKNPLLCRGTAIAALMLLLAVVIGRYVFTMTGKMLLADLDLRHGGLPPVGLLALAFSTVLAMHLKMSA